MEGNWRRVSKSREIDSATGIEGSWRSSKPPSRDNYNNEGSNRSSLNKLTWSSDHERMQGFSHARNRVVKTITEEEKEAGLPHTGVVVNYRVDKGDGWIRVDGGMPQEFNQDKDVYFRREFTRIEEKECEPPDDLRQWKVSLKLHEMSKSLPRAAIVLLVSSSNTKRRKENIVARVEQRKQNNEWLEGDVILRTGRWGQKEIYLKSQSKLRSYFMFPDKISSYSLQLKEGDKVRFQLQPNKMGELKVKVVRMHKFIERRQEDIDKFYISMRKTLKSMDANRAILEILSCTALWKFLAEDRQNSFSLLHLLSQMLILCKENDSDAGIAIESVAETEFARNIWEICTLEGLDEKVRVCGGTVYIDRKEAILTFLQEVVRTSPHKLVSFMPLFNGMQSSPDPALATLFRQIFVKLASSSKDFDITHWSTMAPVPNWTEILGNPLYEDKMLRKVSTESHYEDPEEYMETYYRLTRVELFSAIQKGIKDLLKGQLDHRDMDCYTNVTISAVHVSMHGFKLGLSFRQEKPVKNWESSTKLMFGNLLCISPNQTFDDAIWAVITNRDSLTLQERKTIFVEFCEFNSKSLEEIIMSLQSNNGHTIMVESPTYFRSLWPVLTSLKSFQTQKFSLGDKIIKGIFDKAKPLYTTEHQQELFDSDCDGDDDDDYSDNSSSTNSDNEVYHDHTNILKSSKKLIKRNAILHAKFQDSFAVRKARVDRKRQYVQESLDNAQQCAFNFCLDNEFAIVQGPPGCGKTYLGVKLVETILQWELERPILVMTYKNHALDEFLKHCSQLHDCPLDDIVRIGSQSKENMLDQCNLATILKTFRTSQAVYEQFRDVKRSIEQCGIRIESGMIKYLSATRLTIKGILNFLTEEQLEQFLLDANWNDVGYAFPGNTNQWIRNNLLPKIKKKFASLSNFINAYDDVKVAKDDTAQKCYELFVAGLFKWLPNRGKIQEFRNLNDVFSQKDHEEETMNNNDEPNDEAEDEPDDMGADYVQEKQENRQIAGSSRDSNYQKVIEEAVFFEDLWDSNDFVMYELSDFPTNMSKNLSLLYHNFLWNFSENQKVQFIYTVIQTNLQSAMDSLSPELSHLNVLLQWKSRLNLDRQLRAVKEKKIIGVTITGASIYHDLIDLIAPQVVIVEEAAEILESSLVAALHPKVEHLILIGDHQQLRPQVDTYELVKNHSFDISMMERLVKCRAPFKVLNKQSRMRPEFSALLQDIYPDLEDNLSQVLKNEPANCLEKSMFFWVHDFNEDSLEQTALARSHESRSKQNKREADMVMALALFLLRQGYHPSQITILAAYLGQQKLLRKLQKELKRKYPHLFDPNKEIQSSFQIQTIDMYQGDENDFVLISLTRGNAEGSIGFMKLLNRRCVAQSRAKCGMYFVGSLSTFLEAEGGTSVWQVFLKNMLEKGCVGKSLVIQCGRHKLKSQQEIPDAQMLMSFVDKPEQLCPLACGKLFDCHIKEHACKKSCSPPHRHDKCFVTIREVRPDCGHSAVRKCYEDLSRIPCETRLEHIFIRCGHKGKKKCYVPVQTLKCMEPCLEKMKCKLHTCKALCGDVGHSHAFCEEKVKFIFEDCGHEGMKICHHSTNKYKCKEIVTRHLQKCQHDVQEECYISLHDIDCPHPCESLMSCKLHKCPHKCGDIHNHFDCHEMIQYRFPKCEHLSPKKKKCSEPIAWECTTEVNAKASCGHDVKKACSESVASVICLELCSKERSCGHPCTNMCGEPCDKGTCSMCEQVRLKQLDAFKEKAKKKKEKLKMEVEQNGSNSFSQFEITNNGDTKAEYLSVKDKVMNYIKEMHAWTPEITKIEKVKNLDLEMKYEESKLGAFGDVEDLKFHGTSQEGVEGITKNGFRMPDPPTAMRKPGMYGQGIYFATDSSKSAQDLYTKGSHKLLLCRVLLGKSKVVNRADYTLNREKLKEEGFDSVFAPRGTAVLNDEFVIFNPAQALPVYIIHYKNENGLVSPNQALVSKKMFEIIKLRPSRNFNVNDPLDNYFRIAEAHFLRMTAMRGQNAQFRIKEVDYVCNKALELKFENTKRLFQLANIPDHVVLAFHGTPVQNIESILKNNLDPKLHRRQVHGPGSYFSEFPDTSLGYGNGLILFKTLPGKEYCGTELCWPNHTSKKVNPEYTKGYGDMLIIQNPKQFMPFFVYHLERSAEASLF